MNTFLCSGTFDFEPPSSLASEVPIMRVPSAYVSWTGITGHQGKYAHRNLHVVPWLPCVLHMVYQLRRGEQTLALSALWLIASTAPIFFHVQETEEAVEL